MEEGFTMGGVGKRNGTRGGAIGLRADAATRAERGIGGGYGADRGRGAEREEGVTPHGERHARRGRPPLSDDEASKLISVRVGASRLDAFETLAATMGTSRSEAFRMAMDRFLDEGGGRA